MHIFSLVKLFLSRQFQPIGVQMRAISFLFLYWIKAKAYCKIQKHHRSGAKQRNMCQATQPSQHSLHNAYLNMMSLKWKIGRGYFGTLLRWSRTSARIWNKTMTWEFKCWLACVFKSFMSILTQNPLFYTQSVNFRTVQQKSDVHRTDLAAKQFLVAKRGDVFLAWSCFPPEVATAQVCQGSLLSYVSSLRL